MFCMKKRIYLKNNKAKKPSPIFLKLGGYTKVCFAYKRVSNLFDNMTNKNESRKYSPKKTQ